MIIHIPWLIPPPKPMEFSQFTVRRVTAEDGDFEIPLRVSEIKQLGVLSKKWAVIETSETKIRVSSYYELLDLLSKRWTYTLNRTIKDAQPFVFDIYQISQDELRVPKITCSPLLVQRLEHGVKLLSNNRRAQIALQRWSSSYERVDPLDTVLDCCSALEASFDLDSELRLRVSLNVYNVLSHNKKKAFARIYEMYGIRNKFIHGGTIPEVSRAQQIAYIDFVAQVLMSFVVSARIPDPTNLSNMILEKYGGRE